MAAMRRSTLLAEVNRLPDRERQVLICRYFLDLNEAETAQVLACPRGSVKSRTSRGLARLRAKQATDSAAHRADWPGFHYLLAGIASNGAGDAISAKGPYLRVGSAPTPPAGDAEIAEVSPPLTQPAPAPGFDVNQIDLPPAP